MKIDHIFVDLDDVLCDLVGTVLNLIGRSGALRNWPPGEWDIPKALGMSEADVWGKVRKEGAAFWEYLPLCWWAGPLMESVHEVAPWTIISDPRISPECAAGKIRWIESRGVSGTNLFGLNIFPSASTPPYILTAEKHLLAAGSPGRVLIDDCDANCDAWDTAGGTAILFPRPWNRNHGHSGHCLAYTDAMLEQIAEGGIEVTKAQTIQATANLKLFKDGLSALAGGAIRQFESGATRDAEDGKLDYEGFLSPHTLERYAAYMNHHRAQPNGALRASDNWQKGLPKDTYMKSAWRHFVSWWKLHRGGSVTDERDGHAVDAEEAICGLLFNAFGYLHVLLTSKEPE